MAEDGSLTPEKQLLRLIEETKGSGAAGAPRAGRGPALSMPKLSGLLAGHFSFFKRRLKSSGPRVKGKFKISFTVINRFLAAAAAALFLYLVADAAASALALSRPLNLTPRKEAAAASAGAPVSPLNESSYYLQKAASRDLFKEGGQAQPKKEASEEPISQQDDPATSNLSLVGISWSSNPDVIIEDKESKRTYFVKRGQVIGDNVKVEAIFKDHVVLSHEGQEVELR